MFEIIAAISLAAAQQPDGVQGERAFRQAERIKSPNSSRKRALYESAARQGHSGAQAELGMMLFREGNRAEALRWLKAGSDQQQPRAMLAYGMALFNGDGVAADRLGGYALVKRASDLGLADAAATRSEIELVLTDAERVAAGLAPAAAVAGDTGAEGAWSIQLGAFRQAATARQVFARLEPRLSGKSGSFVPIGRLTALRVGPYRSSAEARAACRALGRAQPCVPVRRR